MEVKGVMRVINEKDFSQDIGASKEFTVGEGLHTVNFDIPYSSCATAVLWPGNL